MKSILIAMILLSSSLLLAETESPINAESSSEKGKQDTGNKKKFERFSFSLGAGYTYFTGNRGVIYEEDDPSLAAEISIFQNESVAFSFGVSRSEHHMVINHNVESFDMGGLGLVETNLLNTHLGVRFYPVQESRLFGVMNPYIQPQMDYWLKKDKFVDHETLEDQSSTAFGFGAKLGLEFSLGAKGSFIDLSGSYHRVSFDDDSNGDYAPIWPPKNPKEKTNDLSGDVVNFGLSYVAKF